MYEEKQKVEKRNLEFQDIKNKLIIMALILFSVVIASISLTMNGTYEERKEIEKEFVEQEYYKQPYFILGQQYLERGGCRAMFIPPTAHYLLAGTSSHTRAKIINEDNFIRFFSKVDVFSFIENNTNIIIVIFFSAMLIMSLAGISNFDYGSNFPTLKQFLLRLFLVDTSFILIVSGGFYLNAVNQGMTVTGHDIKGLSLFLLYMVFFLSFFYVIGFFVRALTRDIAKALVICALIFVIIIFIIHPLVHRYDGPYIYSEEMLPKRGTNEISAEVKAGNYEFYKKDKLETLSRFIEFENYFIEKEERYFKEKIKYWHFFPTLFFINLVDNVICSSYVGHLEFYRFSIDMKNEYFTDFFEKDRFKVPPDTFAALGYINLILGAWKENGN